MITNVRAGQIACERKIAWDLAVICSDVSFAVDDHEDIIFRMCEEMHVDFDDVWPVFAKSLPRVTGQKIDYAKVLAEADASGVVYFQSRSLFVRRLAGFTYHLQRRVFPDPILLPQTKLAPLFGRKQRTFSDGKTHLCDACFLEEVDSEWSYEEKKAKSYRVVNFNPDPPPASADETDEPLVEFEPPRPLFVPTRRSGQLI